MRYATLGTTDIVVSRICLGCMGFGDASAGRHTWTVGFAESERIIGRAVDAGVTFFDTAMSYQGGTSERYLGRALASCTRRDEAVVATKFVLDGGRARSAAAEDAADARGTVDERIASLLDASLLRLGMSYVDLYIYHMWDWDTPVEELLRALDRQVRAGKIRALGISNCFAWQLAEANAVARARGWHEFICYQGHMNALAREDERELVPLARLRDIALTPYSALAAGRLARPAGRATERSERDLYARGKYESSADIDAPIAAAVARIASARGCPMATVALAWLLTKTTAPVVGATRPEHIDGAVKAVDVTLTAEEIEQIERPYLPHPLVGVMAQNRPPWEDGFSSTS